MAHVKETLTKGLTRAKNERESGEGTRCFTVSSGTYSLRGDSNALQLTTPYFIEAVFYLFSLCFLPAREPTLPGDVCPARSLVYDKSRTRYTTRRNITRRQITLIYVNRLVVLYARLLPRLAPRSLYRIAFRPTSRSTLEIPRDLDSLINLSRVLAEITAN